MKFGIYVHTHNHLADVAGLAELAVASAESGWDGFFIWDQVHDEGSPVVDSQIALGAIGLATSGTDLKFGALITPLARRRAWKVAKELATLDSLAPGRVVFGTGLGDACDFTLASSEPQTLKQRAASFEDGLSILKVLLAGGTDWTQGEKHAALSGNSAAPLELRAPSPFLPVPEIPIPIWGSAVIMRGPDEKQPKGPFRRAAAEMDGLFPIVIEGEEFDPDQSISPDELRGAIEWAESGPDGKPLKPGFDLVASGRVNIDSSPADPKGLEEAGATWWLETMREEMTLAEVEAIVRKGPPHQ